MDRKKFLHNLKVQFKKFVYLPKVCPNVLLYQLMPDLRNMATAMWDELEDRNRHRVMGTRKLLPVGILLDRRWKRFPRKFADLVENCFARVCTKCEKVMSE